jgi:dTDP-4-amino-4,6-dideoxygalactose transaminase
MLEDAAEALGATHAGRHAGNFGMVGAFSFNGNKILTAGGGGMLITHDDELAAKVRYWSTQARSDVHWYQHEDIGYNYRMSSLQAALGLSQLGRFHSVLAKRRHISSVYANALSGHPSISVSPHDLWGKGNAWLTTVVLTSNASEGVLDQVRRGLLDEGIETRFIWKPLHQQPVFANNRHWLSGHADRLFASGLCLPSSANMTDEDVLRVTQALTTQLDRY